MIKFRHCENIHQEIILQLNLHLNYVFNILHNEEQSFGVNDNEFSIKLLFKSLKSVEHNG